MAGTTYRNRARIFENDHLFDPQATNCFDTSMVLQNSQFFDQNFFSDPSRSGVQKIVEAVFRHLQENLNSIASTIGEGLKT